MKNTINTMNIMKKALVLSVFMLFISGCSNITSGLKTASASTAKEKINVAGYISTGKSRSAAASLQDIKWDIVAVNDDTSVSGTVIGTTFGCSLEEGSWLLKVSGYSDENKTTKIFSGEEPVEVRKEEIISSLVINVNFVNAEYPAKIALPILDETGKAAKVECILDSDTEHVLTAEFSEGEAVIFKADYPMDEMPVKTVNAEITIKDSDDSTIFACTESLSLIAGMTTNHWKSSLHAKDCDYLREDEFVITQAVLTTYGQAMYSIQPTNTPVVLWNRLAEDTTDAYIKGAQLFGDVDSLTQVTNPLFNARSCSWCFSKYNDLYVATVREDFSGTSEYSSFSYGNIRINKYSTNATGYYTGYRNEGVAVYGSSTTVTDSSTNADYLNGVAYTEINGDEYIFVLYSEQDYNKKFDKLNVYNVKGWTIGSEAITSPVFSIIDTDGWGLGSDKWPAANSYSRSYLTKIAISGSDVYFLREDKNNSVTEILHYTFEITGEGNDKTYALTYKGDSDSINYLTSLQTFGIASEVIKKLSVNDIRIVNDNLYILVSLTDYSIKVGEYIGGNGNLQANLDDVQASTGGVIKYNLTSKTFESWSDGSMVLGAYAIDKDVFEDGAVVSKKIFALPPESTEKKYFYGPRKIIAIKPDELIIADDGYSYEESSLKEKNRVTRVSLKKWAISSAEDINVMFDGKIYIDSGCSTISLQTSGSY